VITADKPVFNGESSSKAYIAYNATSGEFRLAYYDESLGKIVSGSGSNWVNSSITNGITFSGKYDKHTFNISYKNNTMPAYLTIDTKDSEDIKSLFTYDASGKKFILGNKEGEAEGVDVIVDTTEKGTQEWKETLDWGTEIEGIKSNSALNKVVIDIPADQQKAKVYVGKLGAAAPTGATYNKVSPIKTAVAKLDTEVTDAMKAAYHIVTVGGPCINKITAAAMGLTYPACGADSTIPENAAIIEVKDDVFTSGKVVVIVAGWEADNTRLACSVLQNYDAYKSQFGTAKKVKITGTIAAPSIVPA
jgi:protoporphyrinogen oxidase